MIEAVGQDPVTDAAAGATVADLDRARLADALERVAGGDREALGQVYRRTSAKLFGICLRILNERSEAEDVLQEVYLTLWRKAGQFDPTRASPISWLAAMTRNRAIDRLRASGRRSATPIDAADDIADDRASAEAVLIEAGEDRRLALCMRTLAGGDATLIRTAFFEGATYADLAVRAGLPLGTVKSRIRRALLKLRECLGQ